MGEGGRLTAAGTARRTRRGVAQAWIELKADDPAAVSALGIARGQLPAGRQLTGLRRLRLMELSGALPGREEIEEHLHESTRFYNPHKETCIVRLNGADPAPLQPGDRAILVIERDATRREPAERWWRHATGRRVMVHEAVVWVLQFAPGVEASAEAASLEVVRDRRHGLFCNPNAQESRGSGADVPLPWIAGVGRGGSAR